MTGTVSVSVTARLHLGFLDLNGGLGRRFGSIGLALDRPRTIVSVSRAADTQVSGKEQDRAARYLELMTNALGLAGGHRVMVETAIPAHAGLGSGTQLALALATGLRRLHGKRPELRRDALLLGRGARSGIGIGLFRHGGLVVDGGRGRVEAAPPLLARLAVPADWRMLLVMDPALQGLSGRREVEAFAHLPELPDAAAASICRLVLMQALPSVAEDDLEGFGAAISRIQEILGDHFAPAQGGRFTSPRVAKAIAEARAAGAVGLGQSSWGPTGFAFLRGDAAAQRTVLRLKAMPEAAGLDIMICRALNRGASVTAQ